MTLRLKPKIILLFPSLPRLKRIQLIRDMPKSEKLFKSHQPTSDKIIAKIKNSSFSFHPDMT
jgi:hypothetical protein